MSNVRCFSLLRKKLRSETPALRLQTVAISTENDYLDKYKEFWQEYADEITGIDMRDEATEYSDMESRGWECPYPWRRLCITWDGHVLTCPFMNKSDDKYDWKGLGTLNNRSIEEIWNGKEMQKIRESHCNGLSHKIDPCRYCSYRGTELSKLPSASGK